MEHEQLLQMVELHQEEILDQNEEIRFEEIADSMNFSTEEEIADSMNFSTEEVLSDSLMGHTCATVEGMYKMYCDYGRKVGFSVRKNTTRISKEQKVCEKYFVCSCEGYNTVKKQRETLGDNEEVSSKRKRKLQCVRTGCKASLRVKLNNDSLYEVVSHVVVHNHNLTKPEHVHYLRSERTITNEKAKVIETMTHAGIMPVDSFNYMCNDASGEEVIGHTRKDHYNFVTRMKMSAIESGDPQTLIDLLTQRNDEDPDFFYRVKLDENSRLAHIFWRDSRMKKDYNCFGDVVFDTTYGTNRYNLICAPFVGINNHWKNIMFGCAFLSDEREESFVWLFETFKKSMQGQVPASIFTDQDLAMSNAIEKVFQETRHRLCIWHIHKNVVSHFGRLKRDPSFQEAFNKCLKYCSTEEEFYDCWNQMMNKYELQEEAWFKRLFDMREKWCTALNKEYFSAGILSSQRSENTNNAIAFRANKTTSLTEFYHLFENTVKRWRSTENIDEYSSRRVVPDPKVRMNGLQKHAMEIYTKELFADFENEFDKAMRSMTRFIKNVDNTLIYEVTIDENKTNKHTVYFSVNDQFFTCTCKRFEEMKMLCYHIPWVMHMHSIPKIPHHNIANRWCKDARDKIWNEMKTSESSSKKKDSVIPWRHTMAKNYYNLLLRCEDNEETRKMLERGLERDFEESKRLIPETNDDSTSTHASSSGHIVLDPERAKTKGRSKRIRGHFEKRLNQSSGTATSSSANKEFGSKTPNIRLF